MKRDTLVCPPHLGLAQIGLLMVLKVEAPALRLSVEADPVGTGFRAQRLAHYLDPTARVRRFLPLPPHQHDEAMISATKRPPKADLGRSARLDGQAQRRMGFIGSAARAIDSAAPRRTDTPR